MPESTAERGVKKCRREGIMLHRCVHIQNLVQPRLEMEVKSIEISDSEAQNLLKGE